MTSGRVADRDLYGELASIARKIYRVSGMIFLDIIAAGNTVQTPVKDQLEILNAAYIAGASLQ